MNPREMSWRQLEQSLEQHEKEIAMQGFFGEPSTNGSVEAVRFKIAGLLGVDKNTAWSDLGEQLIIDKVDDGDTSGIPANDNIEIRVEGIYETPIGDFSGEEVLQILATDKDDGGAWAREMHETDEKILQITFDGFRETMGNQVFSCIHYTVSFKYELSPKAWFAQYLSSPVLRESL